MATSGRRDGKLATTEGVATIEPALGERSRGIKIPLETCMRSIGTELLRSQYGKLGSTMKPGILICRPMRRLLT